MVTLSAIESERLVLRRYTEGDFAAFCRIYGNHKVMDPMARPARTPDETRQSWERKDAHWSKHGFGLWCVEEKQGGEVIGHCGLAWLEPVEQIEVAYLIDLPYWNRGYATEATQASIACGFELLKLKKIIAITRSDNQASLKVMQKTHMNYSRQVIVWGNEFKEYSIEEPGFETHYRSRGLEHFFREVK